MSLTPEQKRLLDALVVNAPLKLDILTGQPGLPDEEKGACATYSRMLAEVLGEFGIRAEVRPVFMITANRIALDYREGKITEGEAKRRGGRIQFWGDIREGQTYQHAVCYIPGWDVVIDLAMARRASGMVPSRPYWAEDKKFPWWLDSFNFMTYPLEYRGYELYPEKVKRGKGIIRDLVRRYYKQQEA